MIQFLRKILPALFLAVFGIAVSGYWITHKPRAERTPPKATAPLIEVFTPEIISHQTTINAMGSVIAAQSVNLTPRISGMVTWVSPDFIEGGILKKNKVLVELDPTDYKLAIIQSENDLAKAQFNLKLEQGQQAIVKREYQLLGAELKGQEQELVLRKPHLAAAKAAVAAAQASLTQARLNLERTRPVVPFNSIIISRNANVGAWMSAFSTGTPLAKLVGTDYFWINVSVSVDKLTWIDIPGINSKTGSAVKISYENVWGKGVYRLGRVRRLQAELEPEGRMAKLIVEVDDPLCQKLENKALPPLMLGTYVKVNIAGHLLAEAIKVPESSLHDDQQIWMLTTDNTLAIRKVTPLWSEQGYVYLDKNQLPSDARIINSSLSVPVSGMTLRVNNPIMSR